MNAACMITRAARRPRAASLLPSGALVLLAAVAAATTAAGVPAGTPVFSEPLEFTNELMPFEPGAVKLYVGRDDGEPIAVADLYLEETRTFVLGGVPVECAIMQETEFAAGELAEISLNYFAQADDGSVYYFGEVVDNYEDGEVVSHGGSWLVGGPTLPTDPADTATALVPGLFMPADPEVGDSWKPEDLFPIVDETVTAIDEDVKVKVFAGTFEDALLVEETSAIAGSSPERKWYVEGVGFVQAKGKHERLQLVASTLQAEDDDEGEEEKD